jgi:hypothetical protein
MAWKKLLATERITTTVMAAVAVNRKTHESKSRHGNIGASDIPARYREICAGYAFLSYAFLNKLQFSRQDLNL